MRSELKMGVRNEDWPWGAYPRGLRLGRDPVMVIGIVSTFIPLVVGMREKFLYPRSRGGKCVRRRG